ncbi:hypothetical protein [Roseomonas sp. USHLN139]|uniref:hypothetical protein n=1 Tax=Roseomonas sp. USHLN139 TaxID=3081298 RepID=UPI003B024E33
MTIVSTHRQLVRDQVVDLLKLGIPSLKGRVWAGRTWPLQERETFGILVYGWEETKEARAGASTLDAAYAVHCVMAVEIVCLEPSRQGVTVEDEMEFLAGEVCDLVMKSHLLLGADGSLERIGSVKTTLGIDTRTSEKAIGRALLAFGMHWSEAYDLPAPNADSPCEDVQLAFAPATPLL